MLAAGIKNRLDQYDPYGFFRVSSAQALYLITFLFILNFIFQIPDFNYVIQIPLFGLLIFNVEPDFNKRILNMLTFCGICVIYSLLLSIVYNYRILVIAMVGSVILSLFSLSRKYPRLLPMICPIHAITYTALISPTNGNIYQIANLLLANSVVIALALIIMYSFPKVYFLRIWLRAVYLSIEEMGQIFLLYADDKLIPQKLTFKHLTKMNDYTNSLNNYQYQMSVKKISLKLINLYTFLIAVTSEVAIIDKQEIYAIAKTCNLLCLSIKNEQQLSYVYFHNSNNPHLLKLEYDLNYIIKVWNKLCLTI